MLRPVTTALLRTVKIGTARHADEKLLPDSALVFAPHQDDETLGCGGTIAKKVALGATVGIIFMTDGATSHQKWISPKRLREIRREEAVRAAAALGVLEKRLVFLDHPNNGLEEFAEKAASQVLALIKRHNPKEIYIPDRAEPPRDHWITNNIVLSALADYTDSVLVREYPVWLWHHWPWTEGISRPATVPIRRNASLCYHLLFGCRTRVDIADFLSQKQMALASYRSQMERPQGMRHWPILADVSNGDFLACFNQKVEYFREHPSRR